MKLKNLLSILFLTALCSAASAQPTGPSAAEFARAQAAAAAAAGIGQQQALTVGEDGRPVLDANGAPVLQPNSVGSLRDSLRLFQGTTGVQGVESQSSPGYDGRTGRAKLSVANEFTVSCKAATGKLHSAGALVFKVGACTLTGDAVSSVEAQLCTNLANAGTCSSASDFGQPFQLTAGQFSQLNDLQIGLGCNAQKTCLVTVQGSYTVGGNDQSLRQNTGTAGQAAGDGSLVAQLRTAVTDGDYAGKMTEIGVPLQECAQANADAMNTGTAVTCNGDQTVTLATAQNAAQCTDTRQCLSYATVNYEYTRKCVRTFSLTERISSLRYEGTATCTTVEEKHPQFGIWSKTNNCEPPSNGTSTEPYVDPRAGLTKVGTLDRRCVTPGTDPDANEAVCDRFETVEYWAKTVDPVLVSQTAVPSPIAGICDTNPDSETRFATCQNGNWFGRTLTYDQCSAYTYNEATREFTSTAVELNFRLKPGCGFCLTPQVGETCYGKPSVQDGADPCWDSDTGDCTPRENLNTANSCDGMDLTGCTLTSAKARNFTAPGGLVSAQDEIYTCKQQSNKCVQWTRGDGENACLSTDMALGLDDLSKVPVVADGSLSSALIAAAIVDSTARGVEGEQDETVPKIFGGQDMRCSRATGGIGQLFGRNCCRTDIERPIKGFLTRAGCSMDHAKLAAARRSNYATYIGEYCSSRAFWGQCLERSETYCTFEGILPRLVHEQGRQQLAELTASSASADLVRAPLTYSYYDSSEQGSWSAPTTTNGVVTHAWQWPSYCADPATAQQRMLSNPLAHSCPNVVTSWIATCEIAGGCGPLPPQPDEGAVNWQLHLVDPLENRTTATSRFSVVTGACSTQSGQCQYMVSAWPVGIGGKAVVSRDLNWPLFSGDSQANANPSAAAYRSNNIGDLMFRGYPQVGMAGGPLPATVRLDFSRDGGQTWATYQLPTNQKSGEFSLGNSDVKVAGTCSSQTNSCAFRVTGTTTVFPKPWRSPERPDCSGFTAGQISALDFGKMDLSEWLTTVMDKIKSPTVGDLTAAANAQFQAFNSLFNQGEVRQSRPTGANFARAVPSEGFGPFRVKLAVSGVWPEFTGDPKVDTDFVKRVSVDWDDCSPEEEMLPVPPEQGNGFSLTHVFPAPDKLDCQGNPHSNVTHRIKLTIHTTKNGIQKRSVSVENAWSKFPGGNSNNGIVGQDSKIPVNESNVPPPPKP